MSKRAEITILLITVILIISVFGVGSITLKNLKAIEKQSEKIMQPNRTLYNLKLLLAELRSAENCIRSYSLYRKRKYIEEYVSAISAVNSCMDSLLVYQAGDEESAQLLSLTKHFVTRKLGLINQQLLLRNDEQIVNEVNRITAKLNQFHTAEHLKEVAESAPELKEKGNVLKKLFSKRHKEKSVVTTNIPNLPATVDDVKREVIKVKYNQRKKFRERNDAELKLIEEENMVWTKLLDVLSRLEDQQNLKLQAIANENLVETEATHRLTALFGFLILTLLCFLTVFTGYYFYTSRKQKEALKNALNESKVLARAKESFLATMSHEMRTPLNAIAGFTEQLENTKLDPEQKKQLDIVYAASGHLLSLINDVLDLTKIQTDNLKFEKINFNTRDVLHEAFNFLVSRAEEKGLDVSLKIASDVPNFVIGDPLRLRQVLINLFGNSIKFTQNGSVKIAVQSKVNEQGQQVYLEVCVQDTGIGIATNMQDKIFDTFTQADTSITRKFGGSGLGLSITKSIVELQGGKINVESEENKGTKIIFVIPYQVCVVPAPSEAEKEERIDTTRLVGKKLLVADDENFNRLLLSAILKRYQLSWDEAENGRVVLEKVRANDYDLILMDVRMPDMSGIDATLEIRKMSEEVKASVPIIALTAAALEEKKEKCLSAGMNDVITKPFRERELMRAIVRIFEAEHCKNKTLTGNI
jgi:signal transduction histidine kinase/CHASE3 domain sensor protein/ActR/RegA family two-component response regulator